MDFAAGYVQRSVHELPKNGSRSTLATRHELRPRRDHAAARRLDDGVMRFVTGSRP